MYKGNYAKRVERLRKAYFKATDSGNYKRGRAIADAYARLLAS